MERAILGAGCFWGVEHILKKINGILKTDVGYAGGQTESPTYQEVCTGMTGHAEVVAIDFDPTTIDYSELLDVFFRLHDPTTLNRQHNDIGTQYRSVIFYLSNEQKEKALKKIAEIDQSGFFKNPVVTQVEALSEFFPAELYHQDYLDKNPAGYMCHILMPKKEW